jgi:hypothetical protein
MLRSRTFVAALLLVAATACGGGGSASEASAEDYCKSLKSAQQEFAALESGQVTGANLDKIFERMHNLAEQAPAPVADDWRTLDDGISKMQAGLEDLGLSFGDLSDPQKLQDVNPRKLQQFGQEMQELGGQEFQRAGDAIERHAKQECDIKLGQN